MWHKHMRLLLPFILLLMLMAGGLLAQEETPEVPVDTSTETLVPPAQPADPTPAPVGLERIEPAQGTSGAALQLSVFGESFVGGTTVELVGFGGLAATFVNGGALTALVPANVPPGTYPVRVNNPDGTSALSPNALVLQPPPTLQPVVPPPTPQPTNTPPPPTPIPGQPSLVVRGFNANPATVLPGGMVTFTIELVNQGNRTALGGFVAVDPSGKFIPATGQAGVTLPDLGPGTVYTISLSALAAMDAARGPASIPLTLTYRDFEGTAYTGKASLTATVAEMSEVSQVTLARYLVDPNPVVPGQPVVVEMLLTNTGTDLASQVLLQVKGDNGVLLAGPQGDSFPVGNLGPGGSASIRLPLIVSTDAKAGPQPQPIVITFLQGGDAQTINSSITIDVVPVETRAPVLLLDSYDVGVETLQPGDRFTLTMELVNVGNAAADDLLITFGTVESSGRPPDSGSSGGQNPPGGTTSTSTTPSTTFAPLGGGGTLFIGAVGPQETARFTQEFIVDGAVSSGIYSLPVTLRYIGPDGEAVQESLRASVVVLSPPRLRITRQSPPLDGINAGEPFPLALEILNVGGKAVRLTTATVAAENAEVLDGAETFLGSLNAGDDTSLAAVVMPLEEGDVRVSVTLNYLDDLNQPREITEIYTGSALMPPPPIEFTPPPMEVPVEEDGDDLNAWLGRLLLGLLGLGS